MPFEMGIKDVKKDFKSSNKFLLECLENIASKHSDKAGFGINDIPKTKLTWLLLEWKLEVIKRPKYGEKLYIDTWSRYSEKCYSYRDFEIYDENNKKCAMATSKWLLVDIDRGRPIKIEDNVISKYEPEKGKSAFSTTEIGKLQVLENYDLSQKYEVRRSDIDLNGHMHNLNYLDLACNILPEEEIEKEIDNIRITYKKEIKFGEIVNVFYKKQNNKNCILIMSEDGKIVHSIIEMF
jgi:medium-chain acyl-[acyl-carrier-protein] hydrolase